jgi:hypothetical protein
MRIALILILATLEAQPQIPGQFNPAGKMAFPRSGHTATLLPDGRVFFAGGICPGTDSCQTSTEIFDPTTGVSVASGMLEQPRKDHLAILEPDGRVLLIGGGTLELFDPPSGRSAILDWKVTPRLRGQAHRLGDGNLLLACGLEYSAEILNIRDGSLQRIGSSVMAPFCLASAALPGDKLFFASQDMALFLLDRTTTAWKYSRSKSYYDWDYLLGRSSTLLPNGRVLVAGGTGRTHIAWQPAPIFELFDPDSVSQTDSFLLSSRQYHADCLSPDGLILSGGSAIPEEIPLETSLFFPGVASAEIIRLDGSRTERRLDLLRPRFRHTCTLLNDGSVLLAGGESSGELERYIPIEQWPELRIAAALPVASGKALELYVTGPLPDSKILPDVSVGGLPATVLYSSPRQINVQVPEGLPAGAEASVVFRYLERVSNSVSIRLQ